MARRREVVQVLPDPQEKPEAVAEYFYRLQNSMLIQGILIDLSNGIVQVTSLTIVLVL